MGAPSRPVVPESFASRGPPAGGVRMDGAGERPGGSPGGRECPNEDGGETTGCGDRSHRTLHLLRGASPAQVAAGGAGRGEGQEPVAGKGGLGVRTKPASRRRRPAGSEAAAAFLFFSFRRKAVPDPGETWRVPVSQLLGDLCHLSCSLCPAPADAAPGAGCAD